MPRLLRPDLRLERVLDLVPAELSATGIQGLIVDLDNTLARPDQAFADRAVRRWFDAVRSAGLGVVILSNNFPPRVEAFASSVRVPFVAKAKKPWIASFRRALAMLDVAPARACVVGDQLFTDVLGGNLAGCHTVLVTPIGTGEFIGTRLVRRVERLVLPRIAAEERHGRPG